MLLKNINHVIVVNIIIINSLITGKTSRTKEGGERKRESDMPEYPTYLLLLIGE